MIDPTKYKVIILSISDEGEGWPIIDKTFLVLKNREVSMHKLEKEWTKDVKKDFEKMTKGMNYQDAQEIFHNSDKNISFHNWLIKKKKFIEIIFEEC